MTVVTARPKARRSTAAPPPASASRKLLLLPAGFTLALAAFTLLPRIGNHADLRTSFLWAAGLLAAWCLLLSTNGGRRLKLEISLRPQHYLQAVAHASIYVYWGYVWEPMRDAAPLIVAQIVFAYAFDLLLSWTRRDTFALGFGPFPIIFSTNLFLRFRDDWFYLQFALVAVGFLAKELIRWQRDGRRVHIFNPSSFPLAIASLVLIVTETTNITWGPELASTLFQPPHIYLFIFLVALPGQFLFGVSTMTLPAVLTTYLFGLAYYGATGRFFFVDSYIPIAVFLGMHLLFTDPSTAPRTELGRVAFGVMYGASVVLLYWLLGLWGAPTFYDKLLQVPIMNMLVRIIDRAARAPWARWIDPARLGAQLPVMRRQLVYGSLWVLIFAGMAQANALGDHHPGHSILFWQNACAESRGDSCEVLGTIHLKQCGDGAAWSCNEAAILRAGGRLSNATAPDDLFRAGCHLGLAEACRNRQRLATSVTPQHAPPRLADYPLLLREGKGALPAMPADVMLQSACDKGWMDGCASLAAFYRDGAGVPRDPARAVALLERGCDGGSAGACSDLGLMLHLGDGVARDAHRAVALLERSCALGSAQACDLAPAERAKLAR